MTSNSQRTSAIVLALLGVVCLAVVVLAAAGARAAATVVALLAVAAALVLAWRELAALREQVARGGVRSDRLRPGLAEAQRADRVALTAPAVDDDLDVGPLVATGEPIADLDRVRQQLERRLRFVRQALLHWRPKDLTYSEIAARLHADRLLTAEELQLALDLLGRVRHEVAEWPADVRERFLADAWTFATRVGSVAWDRHVRRALEARGWSTSDIEQGGGHRAYFLARRPETDALVAARIVEPSAGTVRRLRRAPSPDGGGEMRVIVVPDGTPIPDPDHEPGIRVLGLSALLDGSGEPITAVDARG